MTIALSILSFLIAYVAILSITALGGMFSEKSGTVALSLEGCMTFGAFIGGVMMYVLPPSMLNGLAALIIMLSSIVGAGLFHCY